jgi:hypothetical protein
VSTTKALKNQRTKDNSSKNAFPKREKFQCYSTPLKAMGKKNYF